jgi:hypothetical protein
VKGVALIAALSLVYGGKHQMLEDLDALRRAKELNASQDHAHHVLESLAVEHNAHSLCATPRTASSTKLITAAATHGRDTS